MTVSCELLLVRSTFRIYECVGRDMRFLQLTTDN
jgi:hypothetical protein